MPRLKDFPTNKQVLQLCQKVLGKVNKRIDELEKRLENEFAGR
jgi:tetrahydromethanopterin S-methyltransferase subunit G